MIIKNPKVECTHCGLPVPPGLVLAERKTQFCCQGCQTAFQLISANGLDAFYAMVDSSRESQTLRHRDQQASSFGHLDDPAFLQRFARELPGGIREVRLALEGIHCAACIWLIEKLPTIVSGVSSARVHWSQGTIGLRWDPQQLTLSEIAEALFRLGYTPHPIRISEKGLRRQQENRRHLARIGIAAAAAGNNMLIAAALYLGMFSHMEHSFVNLFRWISCLIGVASLLGPGRIFLQGGWIALKTRTPHMDLPIAVGLLAGTLNGIVNTIRGTGEIYFDSLTVLICLLLIGRWIQFRQQNRAADSVELLYRLTPQRARRLEEGMVREVMVEELQIGDLLEIRPGDIVPTDAVVIDGESDLDESILSGESKPANKQVGDELAAGTKNITAMLIGRATAVGQETRISKIVELVEQASSEKPQIVQWANRIGGYFVVIIIGLALLTFALWYRYDLDAATDHAIALLVIACPCALAMATPLALSVALGRLAKRRIMIKSGDVMQSLSRPGMIWLDKTGTLTKGNFQVVGWWGDPNWIPWIAAVEQKFTHPIAKGLVNHYLLWMQQQEAADRLSPTPDYESHQQAQQRWLEQLPAAIHCKAHSCGVSAEIEGKSILIGNEELLASAGVRISEARKKDSGANWQSGDLNSRCWVAVEGQLVAAIELGDQIREDAPATLAKLREKNWEIGILSGDHPEVVAQVARQLEITQVHAGVTPEEKLAIIRRSNSRFPTTVMVGDGVNDSAALAAATVGIAVHNGAEASLAAAPVYLGDHGLSPILDLLESSQNTCGAIKRNLTVSLGYNVLGASLAMAGMLHPLLAAVLMPISSITVIGLSLTAAKHPPK
jgi:Cu2+-exporting ATPase